MGDSIPGAIWPLADAMAAHAQAGGQYHQFITVPAMSAGIYTLPAASIDGQAPHVEDEIYYIIAGKGMVEIDGESTPVETGATIFVAKEIEHRFHDIEADLTILVIFAPAHDVAEADRRRTAG